MNNQSKLQKTYAQFLIGYVSAGHTITTEIINKLNKFTDDFVSDVPEFNYFSSSQLKFYLNVLKEILTSTELSTITTEFYNRRYEDIMSEYLRGVLKQTSSRP